MFRGRTEATLDWADPVPVPVPERSLTKTTMTFTFLEIVLRSLGLAREMTFASSEKRKVTFVSDYIVASF